MRKAERLKEELSVVTKPGIYTWEFQPFPTLLLSGQP
jgi:hypothetical protein